MRKSLAVKGAENSKSALAVLVETPSQPAAIRDKTGSAALIGVRFIRTPRAQLADLEVAELVSLRESVLRRIQTVQESISSIQIDSGALKEAFDHGISDSKLLTNSGEKFDEETPALEAQTLHVDDQAKALALSSVTFAQAASIYAKDLYLDGDSRYAKLAIDKLRVVFNKMCPKGELLSYPLARELFKRCHLLNRKRADGLRQMALRDSLSTLGAWKRLVENPLKEEDCADVDGRDASASKSASKGLKGLPFNSFVTLVKQMELAGCLTIPELLFPLRIPLRSADDCWLLQVKHVLDFVCCCAVEARGPTEDELREQARARELFKASQRRPRARSKRKKKGGDETKDDKIIDEHKKRLAIMKRMHELERLRRQDQLSAWRRRYGFDIDDVVVPETLSIALFILRRISLTEKDCETLLFPILDRERASDREILKASINHQRTRRLKSLVEQQGVPPRV